MQNGPLFLTLFQPASTQDFPRRPPRAATPNHHTIMSLTRFPQISFRTQRATRVPHPGMVDLYWDDIRAGLATINSAGDVVYVGSTVSATEAAPVHATAASSTLTSDGTNVAAPVFATGTLTGHASTQVVNGATVVLGASTYTFRVFFATGTLTLASIPLADQTIIIGNRTYTWVAIADTAADEVEIGASASASLDNLIAAINGAAGAGTTYGSETTNHTQVSAAAGAGDTMTLTAIAAGTSGNDIATTETMIGNGSFGAATLTGATGGTTEGDVCISTTSNGDLLNLIRAVNHSGTPNTDYKCAAANTLARAATAVVTNAVLFTALTVGTAGNDVEASESSATLAWSGLSSAKLSGGTAAATMTIGSKAYAFHTFLATGTLTSTGVTPTDGDTVTVGGVTYTLKNTLTASTTANQVLIGTSAGTGQSAAVALDNLKAAVNLTGSPSALYGTLTVINPLVTATTNTNTTQLFEAKSPGIEGNLIATTETAATLSWGAPTLTGATGGTTEGDINLGSSAAITLDNIKAAINHTGTANTDYKCAEANTQVTATTHTSTTQLVVALVAGVSGNSIAVLETSTHLDWTGSTNLLTGGIDATVASMGDELIDPDDYVYKAVADVTVSSTTGWRRFAHSALA